MAKCSIDIVQVCLCMIPSAWAVIDGKRQGLSRGRFIGKHIHKLPEGKGGYRRDKRDRTTRTVYIPRDQFLLLEEKRGCIPRGQFIERNIRLIQGGRRMRLPETMTDWAKKNVTDIEQASED